MFWKLFSFEYYFLQYKHFLLVETFHITGGGAACNINVWFHCLVAAVTSPLHDYIWRNTASEGSTDECAATCLRANYLVFWIDPFYALVATEECVLHRRVYSGLHTQLLQMLFIFWLEMTGKTFLPL